MSPETNMSPEKSMVGRYNFAIEIVTFLGGHVGFLGV